MESHNSTVRNKDSQSNVVEYTPWYNKNEFEEVYYNLFSKNIIDRVKGVRQVTVWESKAYPTLPMGVCSTSGLVSAQLSDELMSSGVATTTRCDDLRHQYCSAIIRFTNMMTEKCQVPGRKPIPLRLAAAKVKLPVWLIDLRHKATHRKLPSLDVLRKAASFSLSWLDEEYWKPELESFTDFVLQEQVNEKQIRETIVSYMSSVQELRIQEFSVSKRRGKQDKVISLLELMRKYTMWDRKLFFETLLSPGLFLTNIEDLESLLGNDDGFLTDKSSLLPDCLLNIWSPVICMLCRHNLLVEFLQSLFECQRTANNFHCRIISAWGYVLTDAKLYDRDEFRRISEAQRPWLDWIGLMYSCAKYPNKYNLMLLHSLVNKIRPPIPEEKKNLFFAMIAIYTGATIPSDVTTSGESAMESGERRKTFTLEDVKKIFFEEECKAMKSQIKSCKFVEDQYKSKKSLIKPADDIGWEKIPLGLIIVEKPCEEVVEEETPMESVDIDSIEVPVKPNLQTGDFKIITYPPDL